MALSDNLKNVNNEIKKINDLGTEFKDVYTDIGDALKGLSRDSKDFSAGIRDAAKLSADLAKSAQELAGFTKEDLKDRKRAQDFVKKQQNLLSKQAQLESKIRVFRQQSVNATKKEKVILDKVVENLGNSAQYTEQIGKGFEDINETVKKVAAINPFKGIAEVVSDIPIIGKAFNELSKAADVFNKKYYDEGADFWKASAAGLKETGTLFSKLAVVNISAAVTNLDERTTSAARQLNISRKAAEGLAMSLNDAVTHGIAGTEAQKAMENFSKILGTTAVMSAEDANNFAKMTKFLGLATQEAAELQKLALATNQSGTEFTETLIGEVKYLGQANNLSIDYKGVLEDVAGTNKSILLTIQGQNKSLGQAAFQAKKMGLSLNQLDNIAGNLLDFESSIAAELEAELMTGKELNLEKARTAAFNGDMATLGEEISKNAAIQNVFAGKNRFQQEAVAKALGMSREELANMITEQKSLSKLGFSSLEEKDKEVAKQMDIVNALMKAGKYEDAALKRKEIMNKFGKEEFNQQEYNLSLQEQMVLAQTKMAESMDTLATTILPGIKTSLDAIVNNAQLFAGILTGIGGLALFGKFRGLLKTFNKLKGSASGLSKFFGGGGGAKVTSAVMKTTGKKVSGAAAQSAVKAGTAVASKSVAKTAAKTGAKLGGKTLLKRIPILGSLVGLGFAVDRLVKGDLEGAAMEAGSAGLGLLDLAVPGLGTGLSLAMDTAIASRDFKRAGTITPTASTEMATGGIVTRPTRALVGEAGSEAVIPLNEFYAKLDELIQAVKAGGNVYLDGSRVGSTMSTSYRSVSN